MKLDDGNVWLSAIYLNATSGHIIGEDSEPYETWTNDTGALFRELQREYGRCVSKVYVDREGGPVAIGWVFERTERYEDTGEPYVREVWVTLHAPGVETEHRPVTVHPVLALA